MQYDLLLENFGKVSFAWCGTFSVLFFWLNYIACIFQFASSENLNQEKKTAKQVVHVNKIQWKIIPQCAMN